MPIARHISGVALVAALAVPGRSVAAQETATSTTISPEARAFLTVALDSLEATSMHSGSIDWTLVRDSAFVIAAGAERSVDTYAAINWALRRVDKHSFLQASRGQVNPEMLPGQVGYLRVPFYSGPSQAPLADSLQSALRVLEGEGACGWIVDLRMNGGGNVWPMQVGIAPLVGDSILGRGVLNGAPDGYTVYQHGAAIEVAQDGTRTTIVTINNPYTMQNPLAPVAVLIDGATGSSAESIAITFRPRPNTRFFGMPTAGYSTINRGVRLPDGGNMVVTVGAMADRNGKVYGGPLQPDEEISLVERSWPTSRDPVARRAAAWVRTQC